MSCSSPSVFPSPSLLYSDVSRETLPEDVLVKMHASGTYKSKYPNITPDDFKAVDGVIIGTPTRYVPLYLYI